jgi:ATP adenylyltransferase
MLGLHSAKSSNTHARRAESRGYFRYNAPDGERGSSRFARFAFWEETGVDHLWAPWRLSYITANKPKPVAGAHDCFLCHAVANTDGRENLLVHRTEHTVVVLNRFPYNNGHLLIAPKAHKARLEELTPEELLDQQLVIRRMIAILEKRLNADGFNVGLNLGRAAGAGLPGHLHWHIVPRWNGDQNFMAVTGDTRVISQSLDALYDILAEELAQPHR